MAAFGLLLVVGVLLRLPALALPLDARDATLAGAAEALADGRPPSLHGDGPLVPLLLAPFGGAGGGAGPALRWLALLAAALLPLALVPAARRLGLTSGGARVAAALVALNPLVVLHAGGVHAGSGGLALLLLALAVPRLDAERPAARRLALAVAVLAPLASPAVWPLAQTLVAVAVARAPHLLGRAALLGTAACAVLSDGLGSLVSVVPALSCLVVAAWPRLRPALCTRLALPGAALLLASAAFAALPGLQARLLSPARSDGARLHELRAALQEADRLAAVEHGVELWGVALDLGDGRAAEAWAARGWLRSPAVLVLDGPGDGGGDGARSPRRHTAAWPEEARLQRVALVTVTPLPGEVTTLGGLGIFLQQEVARHGPYSVLRVRRP